MRFFAGVRAVLGRPGASRVGRARETDRLAATLAWYWAWQAEPGSAAARFAETGAISEGTVDALYHDLVALEKAAHLVLPRCARASGPGRPSCERCSSMRRCTGRADR